MSELPLKGCRIEPLASVLKGLGAFRLLANQKETGARLKWREDYMVVECELNEEQILDWFMDEYAPTPILSPWNGGSGFFPGDKAAQKAIGQLEASPSARFEPYRTALQGCRQALQSLNLREKPEPDRQKPALLKELRNRLSNAAIEWLDAAWVISDDGLAMSPLLGTGGNDGRLEFSSNVIQNLVDLLLGSAAKRVANRLLLRQALFDEPCRGLQDTAIGQYSPGQAGGPNTTDGYDGKPNVNPWDFVLALEGSIVFAAGATRRLSNGLPGATLPFTVAPSLSGHGALSSLEKSAVRCEIWIPTWERAVSYRELRLLFSEGRAQTGSRPARNGVDFARAAASLGVERGLKSFVRYSFAVRNGKNYFASPLGRFPLTEKRHDQRQMVDCLGDLDSWMQRFRGRAELASQSMRTLFRNYDDAVFALCRRPDTGQFTSLLCVLGQVQAQLARTPKFVAEDAKPDERVDPLPPLSARWWDFVEDTTEVRLAAAFRSLPQIRSYVEPVLLKGSRTVWVENTRDPVWWQTSIAQNLNAVMKRRYLARPSRGDQSLVGIELQRWRLGRRSEARAADIEAFLSHECDDERLSQLIRGLLLVASPSSPRRWLEGEAAPGQRAAAYRLPLVYALLKSVYGPSDPRDTPEARSDNWVAPYLSMALLGAGQSDQAVAAAMRYAVSRGCVLQFHPFESLTEGPRVAAALAFPVADSVQWDLIQRTIVRQTVRPS